MLYLALDDHSRCWSCAVSSRMHRAEGTVHQGIIEQDEEAEKVMAALGTWSHSASAAISPLLQNVEAHLGETRLPSAANCPARQAITGVRPGSPSHPSMLSSPRGETPG